MMKFTGDLNIVIACKCRWQVGLLRSDCYFGSIRMVPSIGYSIRICGVDFLMDTFKVMFAIVRNTTKSEL